MAEKRVLIVGEVAEGKLASITAELLGAGRKLASELGAELGAVLMGSRLGQLPQEAIACGADKVYTVDDPLLQDYQPESYLAVLQQVYQRLYPEILLLGQTSLGRDLAPRLAFRLGTGVAMDCTELSIDPSSKLLVLTKPVYGGSALAHYTCPSARPQMATVRAKSQNPLERDPSRKGEVVSLAAGIDASVVKVKLQQRVKEEVKGIKLEDAEVVVSGGRGIGGSEGFKELAALAQTLAGAVGASRPPCDMGWVPSTWQVGLTGKIVSPNLYIAVGISGSSQHLAGCSGARNIVAINKDPEANIFKVSRFGVVGDFKKVLPAFQEKVKELKKE